MLRGQTPRSESRNEGGFTMVELVVAMGMLLLVLGALLGGLEHLFGTERQASTHIDDEQNTRFLIASLTQDLHSAASLKPQPSLAAYANTIDLVTGDGSEIVWSYNGTSTLTRTVGATVSTYAGIVNGSTVPVFSWFAPNGTNLAHPSSWGTAGDVATCASSVQVTLDVQSRPPAAAVVTTTQIALPNRTSLQGCS